MGVDIEEMTRIKPRMFTRGGFGKFQSTLAKIVNEVNGKILRESLTEDQRNWIDLNSVEIQGRHPSPGAAAWVTVTPTTPEASLEDVDLLIAFRARLGLPQVRAGYPCAYCPNESRKQCGVPLDSGAWHAHGCARALIMARHKCLGS